MGNPPDHTERDDFLNLRHYKPTSLLSGSHIPSQDSSKTHITGKEKYYYLHIQYFQMCHGTTLMERDIGFAQYCISASKIGKYRNTAFKNSWMSNKDSVTEAKACCHEKLLSPELVIRCSCLITFNFLSYWVRVLDKKKSAFFVIKITASHFVC